MTSSLSLQQLSDIIGLINTAGRDPTQWQAAMDAVTHAIPGVTGHMQGFDLQSKTVPSRLSSNMSEDAEKNFIERVPKTNVWVDTMGHLPVGKALSTDYYTPLSTIRKTDFYNEWLEPNNIASCIGCFLFKEESRMAALGFHYAEKHTETMTPQVAELVSLLAPHFQQALQMNREQLTTLTNAENLVERLAKPAFILGHDCRIIHMNSAAEHCLKIKRGITLNRFGRFSLRDQKIQQKFKQMVQATISKDSHIVPDNNGTLSFGIDNPNEDNPNVLFITPLLNAGYTHSNPLAVLLGDTVQQAMVTVSYKKDRIDSIETTITRIFPTLTPKETALTAALCQGLPLKEYASQAGVKISTLRSQLTKGIFPKTDTTQQNQLVALILNYQPPFL